jgi:hypothetical protein
MTCPECGSEETVKESGLLYCRKCGLELDDLPLRNTGKGYAQAFQMPRVRFIADPKIELYALKLALKNNQLSDDWQQLLGFKVGGLLKPELKDKAFALIKTAYEKHKADLEDSAARIDGSWKNINNKYFIETENLLKLEWPEKFDAHLSMCTRFGFHNSSKNFIIINYRLDELSNYIIAHELFHIYFRNYVNRFFKEKYLEEDKKISKVTAAFILLTHPKIRTCFNMSFSMNLFTEEYKPLALRLWPLWKEQKPFKEYMISVYNELGMQKTWVSY